MHKESPGSTFQSGPRRDRPLVPCPLTPTSSCLLLSHLLLSCPRVSRASVFSGVGKSLSGLSSIIPVPATRDPSALPTGPQHAGPALPRPLSLITSGWVSRLNTSSLALARWQMTCGKCPTLHTHTRTHMRAHTHTHMHTHACSHTHTHGTAVPWHCRVRTHRASGVLLTEMVPSVVLLPPGRGNS